MQIVSTIISVVVAAAIGILALLTFIQYKRMGKLSEQISKVTQGVEHDRLERMQ